ncbi:DegT/DnrJ/EryC1/StrS aminotransferase family protein [Streptomyces sp. JJ66]|uniref:DegT/DnrJ/EryC1/StrS family aminotransferase n=1 Tax=Streptomyces sp. JJ66 TaxID=2803843 RepID=UPI001C569D5C|nr:DegT/DnrJ/EryC1/StrS aminotransferase family protein [Streptomyces sp. JJ66]MBW1600723.1 DegT/DnrJ/EryC1/StrS aminotransferase family protein [Streptomyces sp. JJ66]
MSDWKVNLYRPRLGPAEADAVAAVLRSGWLSNGPVTREFEEAFARAAGTGDAVAVSNGTAALHLAFLALGLGPGDEVVLPSLSFVSAAAVVTLCGATPVFADVTGPTDLCVDPVDVAARITPRTRAIVAMHYGGEAADLPALAALARTHGVALVEDAAHAPATRSAHGALGTVGDIGCYSFFATKNLATGEGGMAVARDPELLGRIRRLRSHSLTVSAQDRHRGGPSLYDVDSFGLNYRPTELGSAIGLAQLADLPERQRRRQEIVARYRRGLAGTPGLGLPYHDRPVELAAHHLFAVLLPGGTARGLVQEALRAAGVQSGVHYPPTHLFTAYRSRFGCREGDLPVTEDVMERQLSLPLHVDMTDDDTDLVIHALRDAVSQTAGVDA